MPCEALSYAPKGLKYPLNLAALNQPIERDISRKWSSASHNLNTCLVRKSNIHFGDNDLSFFAMMILLGSVFMDDSGWWSYCEVRGDVSHRFESKWTHFERKEAAGYECVGMPEQHMCPFKACMSGFSQALAPDQILSSKKIFSFPLLLLWRLVTVTEVMLAEGTVDLPSFLSPFSCQNQSNNKEAREQRDRWTLTCNNLLLSQVRKWHFLTKWAGLRCLLDGFTWVQFPSYLF